MKLNTLLLLATVTTVVGFSAPKKPKLKPYGEIHQANGKGGKGPLGKQWTSKCDTLVEEDVGPMGARKKVEGPGSKIKRSVDIMPDNTEKVSVLNDLLGYKK
jgi:hypothetical protein